MRGIQGPEANKHMQTPPKSTNSLPSTTSTAAAIIHKPQPPPSSGQTTRCWTKVE
jgi:hypothetical protein